MTDTANHRRLRSGVVLFEPISIRPGQYGEDRLPLPSNEPEEDEEAWKARMATLYGSGAVARERAAEAAAPPEARPHRTAGKKRRSRAAPGRPLSIPCGCGTVVPVAANGPIPEMCLPCRKSPPATRERRQQKGRLAGLVEARRAQDAATSQTSLLLAEPAEPPPVDGAVVADVDGRLIVSGSTDAARGIPPGAPPTSAPPPGPGPYDAATSPARTEPLPAPAASPAPPASPVHALAAALALSAATRTLLAAGLRSLANDLDPGFPL